jgi:hypothetical protein
MCDDKVPADVRRSLVAEAGVLVALCSPKYYADGGCGRDWALFQHRLNRVPLQWRPLAGPKMRVLVRWQPVESLPPGLPRAPMISTDVVAEYSESGLFGLVWNLGPESEQYAKVVDEIARSVCRGYTACLPPLPKDDRPDLEPAFPRAAEPRTAKVPKPRSSAPGERWQPRVFISYAHDEDDPAHKRRAASLADLLRNGGADVRLDQEAASEPQIWTRWMQRQCQKADFIIMVASQAYKRRFEHTEAPGKGKGVSWEGSYLSDYVHDHPTTWHRRLLRVVFPEHSVNDLPYFPGSGSATYYEIDPITGAGDLETLLAYIMRRPA